MSGILPSAITSKQTRYALGLFIGIVFLILIGPTILEKVELNLFNRDLIRLWGLEQRPLMSGFCVESADKHSLQRLDARAKHIAKYDNLHKLHQGMIACLKGDSHAAEEAWLTAEKNNAPTAPIDTYLAALVAFTEHRIIETPNAADIGNYAKGIAYILAHHDKEKEAITWYQFAFAYSPNQSIAKRLTDLYKKHGKEAQIKETWQQLADKTEEQMPDHWWALGKLAELDHNLEKAVSYYQKGAAMPDAGAFKFDMHLGQLYFRQKEYVQASRWFRQASQEKPQSSQPYYFLGLTARGQKQYTKALAYFDQALFNNPNDANSSYYKAITLDDLGRRAEAKDLLAAILLSRSNPPKNWQKQLSEWQRYPDYNQDPDRWWRQGHEAEKNKDWEKAAALYHEGAEKAQPPDDYRLLEREALMYRRLKKWDEAAAIYDDLIKRYPDKLNAYLGRGEVARMQKQYDEANKWFVRAQKTAPDDYRPPYYLGLIARGQQHYEEALTFFETSLVQKPDNPGVLYYKAVTLDKLKRRTEALETLKKAIAASPHPPESWNNLLQQWQKESGKSS